MGHFILRPCDSQDKPKLSILCIDPTFDRTIRYVGRRESNILGSFLHYPGAEQEQGHEQHDVSTMAARWLSRPTNKSVLLMSPMPLPGLRCCADQGNPTFSICEIPLGARTHHFFTYSSFYILLHSYRPHQMEWPRQPLMHLLRQCSRGIAKQRPRPRTYITTI